jgi:hypothetical protein
MSDALDQPFVDEDIATEYFCPIFATCPLDLCQFGALQLLN